VTRAHRPLCLARPANAGWGRRTGTDFITHSPFVILGSAGADGTVDISPKGDPPGFVKVLHDRTLVVPDRPGNKRIDTFQNVLTNPHIGLIFLIPGIT
jgi:predicted pyridoxine 5'-phosphate oxidase superfamily flavin-nucleotide-binding protein